MFFKKKKLLFKSSETSKSINYVNGYSKNLSLLSTSCIQYLLVLTKSQLGLQDIFSKFSFLAVHYKPFFFAVYKRRCLLTCLQHQPTGVGQHGKGAPMVDDLKKRRPEHCFPVISELVHTTTVACCLLSVHLDIDPSWNAPQKSQKDTFTTSMIQHLTIISQRSVGATDEKSLTEVERCF